MVSGCPLRLAKSFPAQKAQSFLTSTFLDLRGRLEPDAKFERPEGPGWEFVATVSRLGSGSLD